MIDADTLPRPDRHSADLESAAIEREIEQRVALRCQADAARWKFRLVALETVMMGMLVAIAGTVLHQPPAMVVRAALLVGASCFASGCLLLGLSLLSGRLLLRLKAWWAA